MAALRSALVLALVVLAASVWPAEAQPVAVVAHRDVPASNLSLRQLRSIFMGTKSRWPDGALVQVIVRTPGTREREVMLDRLVRMNEGRFRQYWLGLVARGDASRGQLKTGTSASATWRLLQQLPGSITLMAVPDVPSGAHVVRVDGRKPGEHGYALR